MKNILVVTYWDFNDPLIQTYTLPYLKVMRNVCSNISQIHLVTFNKNKIEAQKGDYFSPLFFKYHASKLVAALYLGISFIKLLFIIKRKNIDFIHAWCTPAGSLAYLLSKFSGKPLILDSFEPHAESMVENGTWSRNSIAFKLLFRFEKLQLKRATHIIGLTASTQNYIRSAYHLDLKNVFLKPSCVNIDDFSLYSDEQKKEFRKKNSISEEDIVGIYVGKFGGIYLDDEIYDLLKCCSLQWGNNFKLIILTPNDEDEILLKLKKHDLEKHLVLLKKATRPEVVSYLNIADFAINPVKPVASKRYCTSIKDGEYWACGLPVIITQNISDDSDIIKNNKMGSVIEQLSEEAYKKSVSEIAALLKTNNKTELNKKIKDICNKYRSFQLAENIYKEIYQND